MNLFRHFFSFSMLTCMMLLSFSSVFSSAFLKKVTDKSHDSAANVVSGTGNEMSRNNNQTIRQLPDGSFMRYVNTGHRIFTIISDDLSPLPPQQPGSQENESQLESKRRNIRLAEELMLLSCNQGSALPVVTCSGVTINYPDHSDHKNLFSSSQTSNN